jgi:hypothetical protein
MNEHAAGCMQRLEAVLGAEEAMILMEHLPPLGWSEVATTRDLDAMRVALAGELGGLDELGGQIAEVRGGEVAG